MTRGCRRRAAQRALRAAYTRVLHRALEAAIESAAMHRAAKALPDSMLTPELIDRLHAANAKTERLSRSYHRINDRITR